VGSFDASSRGVNGDRRNDDVNVRMVISMVGVSIKRRRHAYAAVEATMIALEGF